MNPISVYGIVLFFMLALPASSGCPPEEALNLQIGCLLALGNIEEFKENSGGLETLVRGNPKDHKIGCCMERALASCYRSNEPSGCSAYVDQMIYKNQNTVKSLGGGACNYECPNGSVTLKPTWVLATVAVLASLLFKKNLH
ncbi:uncharacterized protein LOC135385181 [Ornithodoros turicata]|uniref:uncharacterized protein LOC135385181 n=1 Tax=Ornithodoros turicata TaxID=34597 RepID=UPI0031394DD7